MATTGNRDVVLTVEAKAQGGGAIKALADEVRTLGKTGNDAAPEFARLAAEIDRLDSSADAVIGLRKLETAVEELSAAQVRAADAAKAAGGTYTKLKADADALRASVVTATSAWNEAKSTHIENGAAAGKLAVELAGLTKEEKAANLQLRDAAKENIDSAAAIKLRKIELVEAKAALAAVTAEETAAEAATRKTASALKTAESALNSRNGALNTARGAASALGVETADLAAAEARLNAQLTDTSRGAEKLQAHLAALVDLDQQALQVTLKLADALKRNAQAYSDDAAAAVAAAQAQARVVAGQQAAAAAALEFVLGLEKTEAAAKAADAALDKIGADARKLNADALYVREFAAALDAADAAAAGAAAETKRLATAAEAAAQVLPRAFSQAGVRSIQAIQAEITQTTAALRTLETAQQAGAISALDLARATGSAEVRLQKLGAEIRTLPVATGVLERMNDTVLGLVNRFGALSAAVATVGFAAGPLLEANLQLDSMRRVLAQLYGSAAEAGKQIDFVRRVAANAGIDVKEAAVSFTRFASSAKASGLDTELVGRVFEATANAAGNLGLSSDKTRLILDALGQMANKGTVSMEELRQQLGDSLPGALSLLSKGLGITDPQLVKLVESGKLLTSEALGPLAEAMIKLAAPGGHVESLGASLARLKNQFTLTLQSAADTSAYKAFGVVVAGLADNFGAITTAVKLLAEAFIVSKIVTATSNFIGLRAATTGAAVATGEATLATGLHTGAVLKDTLAVEVNTVAKATNAAASVALTAAVGSSATALTAAGSSATAAVPKLAEAATSRGQQCLPGAAAAAGAGRLVGALGGRIGVLITFALVAKDLGKALGEGAADMLGYGLAVERATKQVKENEEAVLRSVKARGEEATSLVQAKVLYAEKSKTLEVATAANEKLAKAVKETGEASVLAAELAGEESVKLQALTVARRADTEALAVVSQSKKEEADLLEKLILLTERSLVGKGELSVAAKVELASLTEKVDLVGKLTDAERLRFDALQDAKKQSEDSVIQTKEQIRLDKEKLLGLRSAAVEAAALVVKTRELANAADFAAEAAKNNAGRVRELKDAYVEADKFLDLVKAGLDRGEVSQEAYGAAVSRAARAHGLYRDAIKDGAAAGVDFRLAQTGISDEFFRQSAGLHGVITSLTDYRVTAERASPQLTAAFDKQIALAKTKEEIGFVTAEIMRARDAGLLFGADFEDAMKRAKDAAERLAPAVRQAIADAAKLGVTLKDKIAGGADAGVEGALIAYERLKASGKASTKEIGDAFVNLATKAIEANRGIVPEWVKVEAAIRGATISVDDFGKATVTAANLNLKNTNAMAGGFYQVAEAAKKAEDAALRYGSALKSTQYDAEKFALAADGSRFSAQGAQDPLLAKKQETDLFSKLKATRAASALALDKYQNYGKYFLTTGVSPQTTQARQAALFEEYQSAAGAANAAGAEVDAFKKQQTETAAIKRVDSTSVETVNGKPSVTHHFVTLTLPGGTSGTIEVTAPSEAAKLASLLAQLQQDAKRAGG